MVQVKEDLKGKQYGKLTVMYQVEDYISPKGEKKSKWRCKCSCENQTEKDVIGADLKSGKVISCGCYIRKQNKYDLSGEYGIGWTTNTNNEFYFDLEDYDLIKDHCWHEVVHGNGYHSLTTGVSELRRDVKMTHILGCKNWDHINRNPLDNRRSNLRPATQAENTRNITIPSNNTSGFIGIYLRENGKWGAYITINGKRMRLGSFQDKVDAIRARLKAEIRYFGEFAPQRHLFEEYGINELNN